MTQPALRTIAFDTHRPRFAVSHCDPRTRIPSRIVTVGILAVSMFTLPGAAAAQSAPPPANQPDDTRAVPAPWRPNFGSRVETDNPMDNKPENPTTPSTAAPTPPTDRSPAATSTMPPTTPPSRSDAILTNAPPTPVAPRANARPTETADRPSPVLPGESTQTVDRSTDDSDRPITRITHTLDSLPNGAGQIWREYDITPYTSRITSVENPQQAIVDWILRETGTEMWFHQPFGLMHADRYQLYVYHTPETHQVVRRIVDRFVHTRARVQNLSIHLVTVGKPNWREQAYSLMQPIDVHTPGIDAWMISKENAALLLGQLERRIDYQKHAGGIVSSHDGQSIELSNRRPVQFVQRLRWTPGQLPGYQPLMSTVNEGYTLRVNSLSTLDGRGIEAVIECDVDQVEKLTTVRVPVPGSPQTGSMRMNLQIPQMVSWRLKERFRWPNDQVLLLSGGVVANPRPAVGNHRLPDLLKVTRSRADALLLIEYRGPSNPAAAPGGVATPRIGTVPVAPRR